MAKLQQKIDAITNETRLKSVIPVQVGEVLSELNEKKANSFTQYQDPALDPDNDVKNGDVWHETYSGKKLDRVNNKWVKLDITEADFTRLSSVTHFELLSTNYPNPRIGWSAMVEDIGYIYVWNGAQWKNTRLREYSGESRTTGGSDKTIKQLDEEKANKSDTVYLSETDYQILVDTNKINPDIEYNIYEE